MRIISGKFGGRSLRVPKGLPVRPTTDRTREALFNIIPQYIELQGASMLDLFTGTGAVSLEAISRGVSHLVAVDQNRKCIQSIKQRWVEWGISGSSAIQMPVARFVKQCKEKFDLIFMDPPYAMEGIEALIDDIFAKGLLQPEGLLVVEHISTRKMDSSAHLISSRKYGTSTISFFSH